MDVELVSTVTVLILLSLTLMLVIYDLAKRKRSPSIDRASASTESFPHLQSQRETLTTARHMCWPTVGSCFKPGCRVNTLPKNHYPILPSEKFPEGFSFFCVKYPALAKTGHWHTLDSGARRMYQREAEKLLLEYGYPAWEEGIVQ